MITQISMRTRSSRGTRIIRITKTIRENRNSRRTRIIRSTRWNRGSRLKKGNLCLFLEVLGIFSIHGYNKQNQHRNTNMCTWLIWIKIREKKNIETNFNTIPQAKRHVYLAVPAVVIRILGFCPLAATFIKLLWTCQGFLWESIKHTYRNTTMYDWFRKQIWNENAYISILNFFFEEFWTIF